MTVTVQLLGGLGNQMFQYAAGLSLAERLGSTLLIDINAFEGYETWPYLLHELRVPQEMAPPEATLVAAVPGRLRRFARRAAQAVPPVTPIYHEPHFHFDPGFAALQAPLRLEGYFQSWRYAEPVAPLLRERFQPRQPLSPASEDYAVQIAASACPVSLHVRRGDYLKPGTAEVHGFVGIEYYRQAVRVIQGLYPQAEFFLFSDDPDWVEAELLPGLDAAVVRGQDDRAWEDMHLMARCVHHIIANSSFSWWGAWLNPEQEKTVIAPRQWFAAPMLRQSNLCDLLPPGWMML